MIDQTRGPERKVHVPKPSPRPESRYVYHWDRILGALAALGLLIGLTGFGIYSWLKPSVPPATVDFEGVDDPAGVVVGDARHFESADQEPSFSVPEPAPAAADRHAGPAVPESDRESHPALPDALQTSVSPEATLDGIPQQLAQEDVIVDPPSQAVAEAPPAELAETAPVQTFVDEQSAAPALTQEPVRDDVTEASTTPLSTVELGGEELRNRDQGLPGEARPEPSAAIAPDTPVEVRGESASAPGSGGDARVSDNLDEASGEGRLRPGSTSIVSPAVKRFVLAQTVTNNKPMGNLGDIVPNTRGIAEVSSFSEVIGLEGEVLEYRWLHEGEQVLKIRVPVGAERWRSHSTKKVYRKMNGAWRVELRDSSGNLLASIDFVF